VIEKPIYLVRDKINAISPSFCAAKWQQVTMHLQTGHTHSCHHPPTHKIPLGELASNPSALHNTNYKKLQRKKMLNGERPKECDYCWRIEDSGEDALSDRTYKSSEPWAMPYIDTIASLPWNENVVPSYLEVSFSSVCNFKCSYCSPQVSSKWMEEIESLGPYPTSTRFGNLEWLKQTNAMPIPHREENPYVDAFWKWWPEIYTKLEHFRITGGEPLLTKDTFKVLDYIIENPNTKLHFSINTNMCPPPALFDKFIEKIKIICTEGKVKQFKIFTSADAYGDKAEYIRHGLDYPLWIKNITRILDEVPNCTFTVMSTFNALSVFGYEKLLKDVLDIKLKYTNKLTRYSPILIDTPYLRYPEHQAIFILPKEILSEIKGHVDFMQSNVEDPSSKPFMGFFQFEVDKLKRVYDMVIQLPENKEIGLQQKDFVKFVDEHDKRRGTNFLKTFPEMTEFYNMIKETF
jgi:organic radical activating enzyme